MAKNNKDNKRGLGRGLDSLIPKINDDEDEKSNESSLTLEDILSDSEKEQESEKEETVGKKEVKNSGEKEETSGKEIKTEIDKKQLTEEVGEIEEEIAKRDENVDIITEEIIKETPIEDSIETEKKKDESETAEEISQKVEINEKKGIEKTLNDYELASIEEVKEIIEKNPRITLWSTRSSAVFRYLRKTRPEFSISKEASELIEQAVSEKYPEIWKLFEDI